MFKSGRLIRRPSPAMVVAVIALFAALAGTATALRGKNTVKSDDIAAKQVKQRDIAPGAVDPFKTNLTRAAALPAETSTTSGPPADLGGPSVTVKVPRGALVAVYSEVAMRKAGGGADSRAQVHLYEPTLMPASPRIMETGNANFEVRKTSPGAGDGTGVTGEARAGWIVTPARPGRYTFSLRYSVAGGGTGIFRNRNLWVTVIG